MKFYIPHPRTFSFWEKEAGAQDFSFEKIFFDDEDFFSGDGIRLVLNIDIEKIFFVRKNFEKRPPSPKKEKDRG